jgi:hypothetical protein
MRAIPTYKDDPSPTWTRTRRSFIVALAASSSAETRYSPRRRGVGWPGAGKSTYERLCRLIARKEALGLGNVPKTERFCRLAIPFLTAPSNTSSCSARSFVRSKVEVAQEQHSFGFVE